MGGRAPSCLAAVHVNHGLHPEAGAWEAHCRAEALRRGIRLEVRRVAVRAGGEGVEAAARGARQAALREVVSPGEPILLAHHLDDQAETVLLRILRGAGSAGIAAMRPEAELGGLRLVRPLLAISRAEILAYATERGLSWVEDPGNRVVGFDRNHLRLRVLPALAERWPEVAAILVRFADRGHEAASMLDDLAAMDLDRASGRRAGTLNGPAIAALSPARAANALRRWLIDRHGIAPPPRRWLAALVREVVGARADRLPEATHGGVWVRRYRGEIHSGRVTAPPGLPASTPWNLSGGPLDLPHGRLTAVRADGRGLSAARLPESVEVRYRRGGERCRPAPRGVTKSLKSLFQEYRIPPWERGSRPLLYAGGCLASVPGLFVCEPFAAGATEPAWWIDWIPRPG